MLCPNCVSARFLLCNKKKLELTNFTQTINDTYVIRTSAKVEHINAKLGGKPGRKSRMCFQVVCCWCSACQLARAVKNAKSKGFFNQQNGAPEMELMDR